MSEDRRKHLPPRVRREVPRFFKSALFPLIVIVVLVYIASQLWHD